MTTIPAGNFRGLGALYGLGNVDMCNDPGWQFARSLVAAGSTIYGQAAGTDAGHRTAARSIDAVGDAWAATCAAQARGGAQATAQPTESVADVYARARAEAQLDAQRQQQQQFALQAQQQQQQQQQSQAQSQRTLLMVGGGIAAVAVVGAIIYALR